MTIREWQWDANARQEYACLEALQGGGTAAVSALPDQGQVALAIGRLTNRGYVVVHQVERALADIYGPISITASGSDYYARVTAAQHSTVGRRTACRTEVLLWLYEVSDKHPHSSMLHTRDPRPSFYGEDFSVDEINRAARELKDAGLVSGTVAWGASSPVMLATLTELGRSCVEYYDADQARMEAARAGGGTNYHQHINSPVAAAVQGNQNNVTVNNETSPELAKVFEELKTIIAKIVDADERQDLEVMVDDLHKVATAEAPDEAEVQKRLGLIQRAVKRLGDAGLAVALETAMSPLPELAVHAAHHMS